MLERAEGAEAMGCPDLGKVGKIRFWSFGEILKKVLKT